MLPPQMNSTVVRAVFEDLRKEGCCVRCCLRYLGNREQNWYRNLEETLIKIGVKNDEVIDGNIQTSKILKANPCIACLGLLQDDTNGDAIQKICEDVQAASFDAVNFTCAVSLPISFQLRAHSLWLYLVNKFSDPYLELDVDNHVVSIKDVWKITVAPKVAEVIKKELDSGVTCDFFVCVNVLYSQDQEECSCLLNMHHDLFRQRKHQKRKYNGELFTRKAVESALQLTKEDLFKQHFSSPPPIPASCVVYDKVACTHNSVYLAGRYNKFSRLLSQTPWVIDGERKMESSVQELICDQIIPVTRAEGTKFSASGREDVDVRTLGKGRPFVIELLNPHRTKFSKDDMQKLEESVNQSTDDIFIRDLQVISKDDLANLKAGEEEKTKCYTALCVSQEPVCIEKLNKLSDIRDLRLQQKTPIRVLHRRPLAVREKMVHTIWGEPVDEVHFKLHVNTQAGTYIKEFVHGDFGRTQPNVGQLLDAEVDIIALDVTEVKLDWPEEVTYGEV